MRNEGEESAWILRLDALAEQEAVEAARWYDQHSETLGQDFEQELLQVLDQLVALPQIHRLVDDHQTRRALLTRFPYAIYYQLEEEKHLVLVLAILHTSRDPEVWQQRVGP